MFSQAFRLLIIPTLFCRTFVLSSQAPANFGFELSSPGSYTSSNAVQDWTVESAVNSSSFGGIACVPNPAIVWTQGSPEFSIVSTPIIGNQGLYPFSVDNIHILNSPLGGNRVARLNNSSTSSALITRISTQFSVTSVFNLLQLAFASSFAGNHSCCDAPVLRLDIYNCSSTLSPIPSLTNTLSPGSAQCIGAPGYSVSMTTSWTNWWIVNKDLTPFIGQCLKLVITVSDCVYSYDHGTSYFDAKLSSQILGPTSGNLNPTGTGGTVNYCAGSNTAMLLGPIGYSSYQWVAPGGIPIPAPLGTNPNYTVNSPVVNSVWTLQASQNNFSTAITYTIVPTQVNISGLGTGSSCIGGASGSASVAANGSGTGYNYAWLNSSSITVGTFSFVSGLSPGIYSVIVTSNYSLSCGTANATVAIGTASNSLIQIFKPFCNTTTYLCAPSGSNFQWYNYLTPVPAPAGTAPCFTVNFPNNGSFVHLKFLSSQGCSDSIRYILGSSSPGQVSVVGNGFACQGISNGSIAVSMTPAPGSPPGQNTFSLFSTGTLSPVYTFSSAPSNSTSFALSNLPAGNYSLQSFDGSCMYSNSFTINPFLKNYTLSPISPTICSGLTVTASVSFSAPPYPTQYSYSWTPTTWLAGNLGNLQQTVISPTVAPNSVSTIIYSVIVTPSIINCPLLSTMTITAVGPLSTPSISPIPILCNSSSPYTLNLSPTGGYYVTNANPNLPVYSSILTPSLFPPGSNTITYNLGTGSCLASTSMGFQINGPLIQLGGNTQLCIGQTSTLSASGANSYTWNTGSQLSSIIVNPTFNTIYSVIASHTLDNCTSTKTIEVQVFNPPTLFVSGSQSICINQSTTLQANGASTYTWSTGSNNSSIVVNPLINTTYTVSGVNTMPNCVGHQIIQVTVNPGPLIQISGPNIVCETEPFSLIATGADSYTWTASATNWTNSASGSTISASQVSTNVYSLTVGSNSNPCIVQHTYTVYSSPCVGLEEFSDEKDFLLYPCPSSGLFTLESNGPLVFVIWNSNGSVINSGKLAAGKTNLDLRNHSNGVYFLELISANYRRIQKLIIE